MMTNEYRDYLAEYGEGRTPIFWSTKGWGFYDETWLEDSRRWPTREEAEKALDEYALWLESGILLEEREELERALPIGKGGDQKVSER